MMTSIENSPSGLPEDVCKNILDALRPPKHPVILSLTVDGPKGWDHVLNVQSSASTTMADELDVATLMWTLHMKIVRSEHIIITPPAKTVSIIMEALNIFKAVWTTWCDEKNHNGISYEFVITPTATTTTTASGEKYSGKIRKCDMKNAIENWNGKLVPFHPLPVDRLIGRKTLANVRAIPDGVPIELNAIVTGDQIVHIYRSVRGKLRIGVSHPVPTADRADMMTPRRRDRLPPKE